MWSSLPKSFTSDAMQANAWNSYVTVFNVVRKFLEIKQKIWISSSKCFLAYTLMKILIVVRFISIAFVVAKLKFFKVLRTNSASTKWPFLGSFWALTPPKYGSNITEILTRGTIMDIIFWDFLILYQIFFSPQVKSSWLLVINMVYTSYLTSWQTT